MENEKSKQSRTPVVGLRDLSRGTIIRSKSNGKSYIVDANYRDRVTAITSVDITNIDEWEIVEKNG